MPYYKWDDEEKIFRIIDPVWGRHEIGTEPGDEVLLALLHTDLVRRTMAIEQLTLDSLTQTIPATAEFSRWEHIWGSVVMIREMTKDLDLDPRQKLILQLRSFLSDLGHTAYSHLGDWLFQGAGGGEDQHDQELMHLLEVGGINDILQEYDIDPKEVVFPDISDWIENKAPDLCVDRVDYGAREIKRWADLSMAVWFATRPEAFKVTPDGKLICSNEQNAFNFGKAFMLLPTEHWGEPVHRLQLLLKQELVKRVLTDDYSGFVMSDMGPPRDFHPRDYIYTVDCDITYEMWAREPFLNLVRPMMQDIGLAKRRVFAWERKRELAHFFSEFNKAPTSYPDPLEHYGDTYVSVDLLPSNIEIVRADKPEDVDDYQQNPGSYDVWLDDLKPRFIDPLFEDSDGNIQRLSEVNETYKKLLAAQAETMARTYVARLHLNPKARNGLKDGIQENDQRWEEALTRPRMDSDRFKRVLHEVAQLAVTKRLVRLEGRFYT